MRILLIDWDSIIPNLALMKLSQYHKAKNDIVGFNIEDPDLIYASIIFKKNRHSFETKIDSPKYTYPGVRTIIGGSGFDLSVTLPAGAELLKPDYSLYDGMICQKCHRKKGYCRCKGNPPVGNIYYSMGFTSRGCTRKCSFCIVHEKEGAFHIVQHPRDFHDPKFDRIDLLDNNILLKKEWFFEITDWIMENGLKANFSQGLDIRLLTVETAERLAQLKRWRGIPWKFAFDHLNVEPAVRRGIQLLKDAGIDTRHNVQFYVLIGYDTTEEEDIYRCRLLKELGALPVIMKYRSTPWTRRIYRWCRPWIFWSCDIDDYNG